MRKGWKVLNRKRRSKADRFWAHVDKTGECWIFGGCKKTGWGGYGRFVTRDYYKQKDEIAHRVAWELTYGPIPDNMCVLHKCDNPPCVKPDHLFLGTRTDNNIDRDHKGRHKNWRQHGNRTTKSY